MIVNLLLPDDATDEMRVVAMKYHRDSMLKASDWTQVGDAPVDQDAWREYRQALRDFPSTWEPSNTVQFPDAPN